MDPRSSYAVTSDRLVLRTMVRGGPRALHRAAGLRDGGGWQRLPLWLEYRGQRRAAQAGPYLYSYNSYYTADTTTTNDGEPAPIPFEVDVRVHTLRYLQVLESARLWGGGVAGSSPSPT